MSGPEQHYGVVVGVDGSGDADAAIRWAAREAVMRDIRLTLVQVVVMPSPGWSNVELRELYETDADAVLDDAVTNISESMKDEAPTDVRRQVFFSRPATALIDMSKDAEIVVVGARGRGALRRLLLGSVSTALIHHAHCPVAVVDREGSPSSKSPKAPVLLGFDGSTSSEPAAEVAFREASMRGVDLVVLHAAHDTDVAQMLSTEYTEGLAGVGDMLTERLAGCQKRYPGVHVQRAVTDDRPAVHLLNLSATAQLVVVGSHGRGGFAGMALGSVSTAMAHASRTPVIVVRNR